MPGYMHGHGHIVGQPSQVDRDHTIHNVTFCKKFEISVSGQKVCQELARHV